MRELSFTHLVITQLKGRYQRLYDTVKPELHGKPHTGEWIW
jgi:hypothetical protein